MKILFINKEVFYFEEFFFMSKTKLKEEKTIDPQVKDPDETLLQKNKRRRNFLLLRQIYIY